MKSFKSFITEGRDASLYHGTDVHHAYGMLATLTIRAMDADGIGKSVSLTRSFKYAKSWAVKVGEKLRTPCVLELDQRSLAHNYKIVPYNFFHTQVPYEISKSRYLKSDPVWGENEYEERVYKSIKNLDKYLIAIHIFDESHSALLDDHFLVMYKGNYINQ